MTLIRVIDLETTGTEPTDEVVEIGAVDVAVNTHTKQVEEVRIFGTDLVKPSRSIPPEASAVHHLTDNDVKDAKPWDEVWPRYIGARFGMFAAHNAAFENQWLQHTILKRTGAPMICTYKVALRAWPDAPNHKNQTLRYWRKMIVERACCEPAHRALPDAYVTARLLCEMIDDRVATFDQMIAWSGEPALLPTCPIGEWRGKKWAEVEEGFLKWMISKPVDDPDLVWNAQHELKRRWGQQDDLRQAYLTLAKPAIATAQSVDDLTNWFVSERAERFAMYGITEDCKEYKALIAECAARKAELQKEQSNAAAAA